MITSLILEAGVQLFGFLAGLIPDVTLPSMLTGSGSGTLQGAAVAAGNGLAQASTWLPTSTIATCLPLVGAAYVTAATVWLARRVVSLFTGGGA
jgi:hypothetical protein